MTSATISLKDRLLQEDAFVRTLIDTIPPKIYFDHDVNEHLEEEKHAYIDASVKRFGKKGKKLNIRGKHKRARLDPFLQKTVSEIQENMMEKLNSETGKKQLKLTGKSENPLKLREKLSKKIDAFKANRGNNQKMSKPRSKPSKKNVQWKITNHNKTERNETSKTTDNKQVKTPKTETPIFNKEGKLVYSKFDFVDTGNAAGEERKPPAKKKFKKALDKLKQEKDELTTLSAQDPERAENLAKKRKWQTALDKSEGVKVKDNPEMLKKSLKRREQKKKKSQKQWMARNEKVQMGKEEKQEKRTKNIRARKQAKIDKKIKLSRRKGRGLNGF